MDRVACTGKTPVVDQQIPTKSTIAKAYGSSREGPLISARVHHEDFSQGLTIVTKCLFALNPWTERQRNHTTQSLQRWVIDAAYRTRSFVAKRKSSIQEVALESVYSDLTNLLQQYFLQLSDPKAELVSSTYAADLICQTLSELLRLSFQTRGTVLSNSTQLSMCWSLNVISWRSSAPNSYIWKSYHQHLDSLVLHCVRDSDKLRSHAKDFQVPGLSRKSPLS